MAELLKTTPTFLMHVFAPGGVVYLAGGMAGASDNIAPFRAKMGIAPERLWAGLGVTSRLWTATSP